MPLMFFYGKFIISSFQAAEWGARKDTKKKKKDCCVEDSLRLTPSTHTTNHLLKVIFI